MLHLPICTEYQLLSGNLFLLIKRELKYFSANQVNTDINVAIWFTFTEYITRNNYLKEPYMFAKVKIFTIHIFFTSCTLILFE